MSSANEDEPFSIGEGTDAPNTEQLADDINTRLFKWRRLGAVVNLGTHGKLSVNSFRVRPDQEPGHLEIKHREGKGRDRHKNTKYIVLAAGAVLGGLAVLEYERRKKKSE